MKRASKPEKIDYSRIVQIHIEDERVFKRALNYLGHPGSIMWRNFLAGTFHGLGFMVGTAVILTLIGYVLGWAHESVPFLRNVVDGVNIWYQEQVESQTR